MRTRIRLPLAVLGTLVILFALSAPAFAQEGETEFKDHAAEECHELLEEGKSVDDCQEAPNPLIPEVNEIIWGGLAFLVLLVAMWKWGLPAVRGMMQTREERIRTDLERAGVRQDGSGTVAAAVPGAAGRRSDRSGPHHRRGSASSRPRRDGDQGAGRGRRQGDRGACAGRHRPPARSRARRTADRGRRHVDLARGADRRAQPRPHHADAARRQLHQRGREQLGDGRPRRGLRTGTAPDRRSPKGTSVRSRTSSSGSRASSTATTSCAWRSRTGRCPPNGAPRSSKSSSRAAPCRRRVAIITFIVTAGRGHDLTAIVQRFVELAAQTRQHEVAEVRSAVPLDDAQVTRLAEALSQRDRQADRSEGRHRREGAGRPRRNHRRHRDRRHRAPPPRAVEGNDLSMERNGAPHAEGPHGAKRSDQ